MPASSRARPRLARLRLGELSRMARSNLAVVGHVGPTATGETLSSAHALAALAPLGQPTRLAIVRLLMRQQPAGVSAGKSPEVISWTPNPYTSPLSLIRHSRLSRAAL